MANWTKGVLKVRGSKENLLSFLQDGLELAGAEKVKHTVLFGEYDVFIEIPHKHKDFHIKETSRHFIDKPYSGIWYYGDEMVLVFEDFCSAWSVNALELADVSAKYQIDFKIYAFEAGSEFNQDIEIVKGKIIKDEEISFDNYVWECINPNLGG